MDILFKLLDGVNVVLGYVSDYFSNIPAESLYALGTLLGGSAIVTGVVAWINRRRLKKDLEKLGRGMVTFVVAFLSALVTVLDFILNNGSTFGVFLPYFATHMTQVIGISTVIYNVAKPSLAWWRARKENKPFTNPNHTATVEAMAVEQTHVTVSQQPSSSLGSQATGRTAPSMDLLR